MATKEQMFVPTSPGMNCRDGKLFLFKATVVTVVKVADGPQCWKKRKREPVFRPVFPPPAISASAFSLVLQPSVTPDYVHWSAKVEAEFLEKNLDRNILEAMARYRYEHWRMCALTMRADGLDLVQANPGLAYLVASNNLFAGRCCRPWRRARSMMHWKRTRILEQCGFPARPSVVKILSRIDPATLRYPTLVVLRRLLVRANPAARKRLGHLPRITPLVLRILATPSLAKFAEGGFLDELAQAAPSVHNAMSFMFNDALRMAREMDAPIGRCRGFDDLKRIHDRLVDDYNTSFFSENVAPATLPPGPIPDLVSASLTVEHIQDTVALARWAIQQRNCLASYHQSAMDGKIHLYRITAPEEASLSVVHRDGQWHLGEIAGKENAPVGEDTLRQINTWFCDGRVNA
jgi:hypothetical protein